MDKYPITKGGDNANADGDNRLGKGGCFVGRDVHSNPLKDVDGAETDEHLNAVGQWLKANVARNQAGLAGHGEDKRGIWCTNCHTQLSQELWRAEDCDDLINGDCLANPRAEATLEDVAKAVGLTEQQAIEYLDPKNPAFDASYSQDYTHAPWSPAIPDANVATIEVSTKGPGACAPLTGVYNPDFGVDVCVSQDGDGDPSVNILSFCTTADCVSRINNNRSDQTQWRYPANPFQGTGTVAAAVPFSAATDGRDHWLAAGEPHCADCHAAPYVEQTGNQSPLPPFNYPAKAALMRYSKGHQGISCQGCHESIHGLYPVGPAIDNTTYAQAAALNHDGSHGPLKCGTCHAVEANGVASWIYNLSQTSGLVRGQINSFDDAVGWAHTYTDQADVLNSTCQNCHGANGDFFVLPDPGSKPEDWSNVSTASSDYLMHAGQGVTSRLMMDKAEVAHLGYVLGDKHFADGTARDSAEVTAEREQLCSTCHSGANAPYTVTCSEGWKQHLTKGMVAESVWEDVSEDKTSSLCGW